MIFGPIYSPFINVLLHLLRNACECLDGVPSIDTGGVRRHVYTTAYAEFIQNKHIHLFDGPENHLRPYYSAESRGSGIVKALGLMVGHSICQDAIGFNFFSPLSYWYIACGEEVALQYSSLDIGEDSAAIISKVCVCLNIFKKGLSFLPLI